MLEKLMKFKASKKTSLLLSLFCILMCVTVLIGTSFAWFTDTVTSGSNRIQTGTLKVGMEYRTVTLGQTSQSWKDANGAGDILDPDALYEPGYVSLTLFRIENKGSLSFKYQLALKLAEQQGINVFGEPFKLSDYLSFNLIPLTGTAKENALGETATYQREDALALLNNNPAELGFNAQNTVDAVMPAKENGNANDKYDVVALVIYMPETVGNKAMYDTTAPSITLDFKLVATQYTDEKDSFDQYYDEKAVYNDEDNPVRPNWTAFQYIKGNLANTLVCYDGTGFPVVRVTSANAGTATLIVSECNAPIGFNVNAGTIYKSYNISVVDDNGNPVAGDFTVQMYVGEGYPNLKMYHNGVEMAAGDYSYNADDGYVTFTTNTFSVFTAVVPNIAAKIGDKCYSTIEDAFNAVHDGDNKTAVIELLAREQSIQSTLNVLGGEDITVDLNGCTLSSKLSKVFNNKGTLTLKDSYQGNSGIVTTAGILDLDYDTNSTLTGLITSSGTLNIESGVINVASTLKKSTNFVAIYSTGTLNISGGEISSKFNRTSGTWRQVGSICVYTKGGTLNMSDGVIKNVAVSGDAHAIKAEDTVLNITGGSAYNETDNNVNSLPYSSSIWLLGTTSGTISNMKISSSRVAKESYEYGGYIAYGIHNVSTGAVALDGCNISTEGSGTELYGILSSDGSMSIENTTVSVTSKNSRAFGIYFSKTAVSTVKDCVISITNGADNAECITGDKTSDVRGITGNTFKVVSKAQRPYAVVAKSNSTVSVGTGNSLDLLTTGYRCRAFYCDGSSTLTVSGYDTVPFIENAHIEWSN